MIENFIENILKIKKYKSKLYNSGKDNLTYEIVTDSGENFILQEVLGKKTGKNLIFIDEVISYINKNSVSVIFAEKYINDRFITHNNILFQLMKKINGKTIHEKEININLIKNTAKYIASFHNDINNFDWSDYEDINYYKKMHNYRLDVEKLLTNNQDSKIENIFSKMNDIAINLKENHELPKGVIHGDPSFKNYLIDDKQNIVGLIDYDMLSINNYLWDLADLIRSYMKIENFQKKEFEILINSYNSIRKLSDLENNELQNYCTMMILDTGFRYLLSTFQSDKHKNLLGDKSDSLKKAKRCLSEIKKLNTFYN